jgi:biotin carboxyl carrier protein
MEKETNKWVTLNRGEYLVTIGNSFYKVCLVDENNIAVNNVTYNTGLKRISDTVYELELEGISYKATIENLHEQPNSRKSTKLSAELKITVNDASITAIVDDQRSLVAQMWLQRKPHAFKRTVLRAPMPGLISKVEVQPGQVVQRGGVLIILEAMKMENEIRALQECRVESVSVIPNTTVERGDELITILES